MHHARFWSIRPWVLIASPDVRLFERFDSVFHQTRDIVFTSFAFIDDKTTTCILPGRENEVNSSMPGKEVDRRWRDWDSRPPGWDTMMLVAWPLPTANQTALSLHLVSKDDYVLVENLDFLELQANAFASAHISTVWLSPRQTFPEGTIRTFIIPHILDPTPLDKCASCGPHQWANSFPYLLDDHAVCWFIKQTESHSWKSLFTYCTPSKWQVISHCQDTAFPPRMIALTLLIDMDIVGFLGSELYSVFFCRNAHN